MELVNIRTLEHYSNTMYIFIDASELYTDVAYINYTIEPCEFVKTVAHAINIRYDNK